MNTSQFKNFDITTQHYGTYFTGFDWTVFGCLTFKHKVTLQHGEALVKSYMRRLGEKLKAYIPYIAVPEYQYSGLGAPIRLHFHYLAACPPQWKEKFPEISEQLWSKMSGHCKIEPYDPAQNGGYYLAKLAPHNNFEWLHGNLDRLTYVGGDDLFATAQTSPYVPAHAKGLNKVHTLTVSKKGGYQPSPTPTVWKSTAPAKLTTHCPPKTSDSPFLIGKSLPTIPTLNHVWQKLTGKVPVGKLSPKQWGQLGGLRKKLGHAVLGVIEYAAKNWSTFAVEVGSKTGHPGPPGLPDLGFLYKYCQIALTLAYKAAIQKLTKKTPSEWNLIDAYPSLLEK